MSDINILLATYNGGKFIEAQILSLMSQSYTNWRLIIHDDGSKDETLSIIKKWSRIDPRIVLIEDGITYGNAVLNFMHMLQFSTSEFTMFCDQDDIWLDTKLEEMFNIIKQKDNSIPQVVYSSAYIWGNDSINTIRLPFFFPQKIEDFVFLNLGVNGCFAIFNKPMLELMKVQPSNQAMHDHLLHLIGITMGEVSYMKKPLMLYRRHENTVTNGSLKLNPLKRFFNNSLVPVVDKAHYDAIDSYYNRNKDMMNARISNLIQIYLDMPNKSLIERCFIVIKYKFRIGESRLALITKMFVRPFLN